MKGSRWVLVVLILLVIGTFIIKQTSNSNQVIEPSTIAQVSNESSSFKENNSTPSKLDSTTDSASVDPGPGQKQSITKPLPSDSQANQKENTLPQQLKPVSEPKASETTSTNPDNPSEEQPKEDTAEQKPALGPKPEGPLPGSKMKECLNNSLPTMADFGMGTCRPCKEMEPILKQATLDYWGRANIIFVELDKYPALAREYGIRVMPTQIFFDASGKQIDSHMGYMDRAEIDRRLSALGVK